MLELFTTAEKAKAMLANPVIEMIFFTLFIGFFIALFVHVLLYVNVRRIRNYIQATNRIDIEPLHRFKIEFEERQQKESLKIETFVQKKFSGFKLFHIPVIQLMRMVQMTISVFILLGVLGTFIGLTISLGSIQANEANLVENVTGVLSGIDVAFYTSIVGMGFSLVMTVLLRVLNTEYMLTDLMLQFESHLEAHERHGMNGLIHISESIHHAILRLDKTNQGIVGAFDGFKHYTDGLEQAAKDLATFNEGLTANVADFHTLFEQMKIVTDGFKKGTAQLNAHFDSLFSYFKKADQKNERVAYIFETTYEKILDVTKTQIESFQEFDETSAELKRFTSSLLEEQKQGQQTLTMLGSKTGELVDTMGLHHRKITEVFGNNLKGTLTEIATNLENGTRQIQQVGGSIVTLPKALDAIQETYTTHKHLLEDRFTELKQFHDTFHTHLNNYATQTENFDTQLRNATALFEQLQNKNNLLLQEMNNMTMSLARTFSTRDKQLDTNVTLVKDTLTNYVTTLEGTLGQKLDTIMRQMETQSHITHDGMNRDFAELRRISEDMYHHHTRAVQQVLQELSREIQKLTRQLDLLGQEAGNRRIGMSPHEY